jgi:hypothetical protein
MIFIFCVEIQTRAGRKKTHSERKMHVQERKKTSKIAVQVKNKPSAHKNEGLVV